MSRCRTIVIDGVSAKPAEVTARQTSRADRLRVEGDADPSVHETVARVEGTLKSAGIERTAGIVLDIAPRAHGQGGIQDLACAVAAARLAGILEDDEQMMAAGSLSHTGRILPAAGMIGAAGAARADGRALWGPEGQRREIGAGGPIDVRLETSFAELIEGMRERVATTRMHGTGWNAARPDEPAGPGGHRRMRRAVAVAVAGRHSLLIEGSCAVPSAETAQWAVALDALGDEKLAEQVAGIHAAAGLLAPQEPIIGRRPLRAPHHSASAAALLGRWKNDAQTVSRARPGELTLAHGGVLYLDEADRWRQATLHAAERAWRRGQITLESGTLPAACTVIAFCEAGGEAAAPEHLKKRFDMRIRVDEDERADPARTWETVIARTRVERAARRQASRYGGDTRNGAADAEELAGALLMTTGAKTRLATMVPDEDTRMTVARIARTIADMTGRERVGKGSVDKAVALATGGDETW